MYKVYFNNMRFKIIILNILVLLFCNQPILAGTTGKFAGTVVDAETGKPLPGVNILIEGTQMGAVADINGNYTILYVPPGVYSLRASIIGYTKMTVNDARVLIDQTTRIDFKLKLEVLLGEETVVVADRNPIKLDVSTSVTAVSSEEFHALPVNDVTSVVGLQAGMQGLNVRGSGDDKTLFLLNGVMLRDPRDNKPIATLPLSAVQEVSVQRGGFNAEYGQVQSGIVNVVTKEGNREKYTINMDIKYSSPQPKHFGISPYDKNSYFLKPYLDDAVAWEGTKNWDRYTAMQYPSFDGWNEVSRRLMSNNNPNDDLSPLGAQQVFIWEHRKQETTNKGDYNIDAGFGGPVPFIGKKLGNLRFFTSYRRQRDLLIVPLHRDDYLEYDFLTQVTSDISDNMKLRFTSMAGKRFTAADNWVQNWYLTSQQDIASRVGAPGVFGTGVFSPADLSHQSYSLKLTHTLNPSTFYEASLEHLTRDYNVRAAEAFDATPTHEIVPGYFVDDAPLGFAAGARSGIDGTMISGHTCRRRDQSVFSTTTAKIDLTSQVNFENMIKAGAEFVYNTLDMNFGWTGQDGALSNLVLRKDYPIRAALYAQDKLEAKGFIVNAGLRLDYSNANTDWYAVSPYDESFFSGEYQPTKEYKTERTKGQYQLSPRLGISHPITENSKLFFNYGHFKQMPTYENLFKIDRSTSNVMGTFGNPNLVLAKTIAYELGYDHSITDAYLIQLAAYYKDISDQEQQVNYYGLQGVSYVTTTNNGYADIRGLELSLRKSYGRFWRGFANYTYAVSSSGYFEGTRFYQDPKQQSDYNKNTINFRQTKPVATPYARLNLQFFTPEEYGFSWLGIKPLENITLSFLGDWQDGGKVTRNPNDSKIVNNVKVVSRSNFDLRFEKVIRFKNVDIQFYADIYNLFNLKRFSILYDDVMASYGSDQDRLDYWDSLHLPESSAYDNIPGDDKFGEYRKTGVAFQPMERRGQLNPGDTGNADVIYWIKATEKYVEYDAVNQSWNEVEPKRLKKILDDKAYIDMPNITSFSFLNPRHIFYGIRINYNL